MKLQPTAKPIRIRILSGGDEHSSLDSLRHNFSLNDIQPLIEDGRLGKWLERIGATELAYSISLIGRPIEITSKQMIELTGEIFNTTATKIEDLQELWLRDYPKTYLNFVKENLGTSKDIAPVREAYALHNSNSSSPVVDSTEWQKIYVDILKRMPLAEVLADYREFGNSSPMNSQAWGDVLKHHATSASDKQLRLLAQSAIEDPLLKNDAIEWYKKSAMTDQLAKEWINKNLMALSPKKKEIFDKFESDPERFSSLWFDYTYPQQLVEFLRILSETYEYENKLTLNDIPEREIYSRYLYILRELYWLTSAKRKDKCLDGLRKLYSHHLAVYHFGADKYPTLRKIIESIDNNTKIDGVRLEELDYREAIMFIAGLAKVELVDYEE